MKPNDFKGRLTSIEKRFTTKNDCDTEASKFRANHPHARSFPLSRGFSFQPDQNAAVEERFLYVAPGDLAAPLLEYYEALENNQPMHGIGNLRKLYNECTGPNGGYEKVQSPDQNGGVDVGHRATARCIMKVCGGLREEYLCLMINPPFPHGSGAFERRKKNGVQKYLLLAAGIAGAFATGLMWKQITKIFGNASR